MRQPKFDIGDKVINTEKVWDKTFWRNNAPEGSVLKVEKIIISEKEVSYEVRSSRYSTFTLKEEILISEKDFLKQLRRKFKK